MGLGGAADHSRAVSLHLPLCVCVAEKSELSLSFPLKLLSEVFTADRKKGPKRQEVLSGVKLKTGMALLSAVHTRRLPRVALEDGIA